LVLGLCKLILKQLLGLLQLFPGSLSGLQLLSGSIELSLGLGVGVLLLLEGLLGLSQNILGLSQLLYHN